MAQILEAGFELSVSAKGNGALRGAYITFSNAKVKRTKEILEDALLADYSSRGKLVGVEILGPVRMPDLLKVVNPEKRLAFRKFLKHAAPPELVSWE